MVQGRRAQAVYERAVLGWSKLVAAGKEALSSRTRWRLPADHTDALPVCGTAEAVHVLTSPEAVLVVVAGAANAGVSAVVETFGPRGGPPPVVRGRRTRSVRTRLVSSRRAEAQETVPDCARWPRRRRAV
jgi:hypothetical protein